MGKLIIAGVGGSGAGSDDCTSTKAEVLKGYKAITKDSNDEVGEGTLELTGDAADSHVLAGKSYYSTNPKAKKFGSMSNIGAVSSNLSAGEEYVIPAGFHNGGGKITAKGLASQTPGNATASQILQGYEAWVNGAKIPGAMTVNSILSFSVATYDANHVLLTWQNPYVAAGKPFSGVAVNYSTSGYPGYGGTNIYTGYGNNASPGGISQVIVAMPATGVTYYFSCFSYVVVSAGNIWGPLFHAYATTTKGQVAFTSSGVFVVPEGVRTIDAFYVGGGAGGHGGMRGGSSYFAGGGGGSGRTVTKKSITVSPGQSITVVVGAGGSGGARGMGIGTAGGDSYIIINGSQQTIAGGGSVGNYQSRGGDGGSGGGGGGNHLSYGGGSGGSDGSNSTSPGAPGTGQGTTTRAFGELGNTLYAGAGGGGASGSNGMSRGSGGAGGGGNGQDVYNTGSAGTAGTGGGGGGGGQYGASADPGSPGYAGGSGVCIFRWGY